MNMIFTNRKRLSIESARRIDEIVKLYLRDYASDEPIFAQAGETLLSLFLMYIEDCSFIGISQDKAYRSFNIHKLSDTFEHLGPEYTSTSMYNGLRYLNQSILTMSAFEVERFIEDQIHLLH